MIVFSGIDSSGKSTQIRYLNRYFRTQGNRTSIVWSRGGYTSGMEVIKKIIRWLFKSDSIPEPGDEENHKKVFKNTRIAKIWLGMAISDLIRLYSIQLKIMNDLGFIIICDRYINDTLIDFRMKFPGIDFERWILWRLLEKTALKPYKSILLEISIEESLCRSEEKNEPFPESEKDRRRRYNCYMELKAEGKWDIVIDGQNDREAIFHRIKDEVNL